ncbi:MAG TPA: helix-turn-helix domain-containing protein [Bryobacteraceae bacterium]|jgi:cytoskeletal protein RodZ|nr:helix-turn-helix domain-containing protein [Bryobacteraceae bacterium]
MTSIGETLRRERQKRNLDLPKVAAELKISTRFLDAMEHDDFSKLPGGVFTKSFVRQYAIFLGLNGDELVAEVGHAVEPPPVDAGLPPKTKPDVPGIELKMGKESWQSVRHGPGPLPSWFRAGLLLVLLMLVCSGVYWWFEKPRHPVSAHETPVPKTAPATAAAQTVTAAAPAPPPAVTGATEVAAKPAAASDVAAPPPAATPDVANPPANPNATVRVGITANESVWVRADVNGKYAFSGTLQPHETREIDGDGEVTLRLGNAGGATITLNGKPVDDVGPKGQIRTVQFTSGGFQIVSPPKLLDPLDRL